MYKPIFISISPNSEIDDIKLSIKLLLNPINWFNFRFTEELEQKFASYFGKNYYALAVNSGRSAMFLILKNLGIGLNDDVCVQAFTCSAAVNPIFWNRANPVYIDIDKSFNLDPIDLKKKLTNKTKAIVVQHTFGCPANMSKIKAIAKKRKIKIIEDCALSLGASVSDKKVGTLSDVSFFSFGRDKVISGTFGGMILTSSRKIYQQLKELRDELDYPKPLWTFQQLANPFLTHIVKKLYFAGRLGKLSVGKVFLWLLQSTHILGRAVDEVEKYGFMPKYYPKKMPGSIAKLISSQFNKLSKFNAHREKIAKIYFSSLSRTGIQLPQNQNGVVWLRFPVKVKDKNKLIAYFAKNKILIGDWYKKVIYPVHDLYRFNYSQYSCPMAENAASEVVNLPTNPNMSEYDAKRIVELFNKFNEKK